MLVENTQKLYLTRLLDSEMVCHNGNNENKKDMTNDLKKFVCKYCGETWYVKNISEKKVKACPFCLKNILDTIVEKPKTQDTRQIELAFMQMIDTKQPTNTAQDEQILLLGKKLILEKHYEEGIKFIRYAVAKGIKDANFILGYCYEFGVGVKEDKKAALGFYRNGAFFNKNFKEFQHANKAAYKDNPTIMSIYAQKVIYDKIDRARLNVSAKEQISPRSQENVIRNDSKNKASNSDNPQIRFELAAKNIANLQYKEAVDNLRFASQHGHKQASLLLGYCYENGLGIKKDIKAAEGFYRLGVTSNPDYKKYMGPYGITDAAMKRASKDAALWFKTIS